MRKGGNRVPITDQLIDTATGAHIWAGRFDGALDDVCELQDQVASSVASAIDPKLRQSEIERTSRNPTDRFAGSRRLIARSRIRYTNADSETMLACVKSRLPGRRSRVATLS